MSEDQYDTECDGSAIRCPRCSGECLTNGETLSCNECAFQTSSDSLQGQRLIEQYYESEELV